MADTIIFVEDQTTGDITVSNAQPLIVVESPETLDIQQVESQAIQVTLVDNEPIKVEITGDVGTVARLAAAVVLAEQNASQSEANAAQSELNAGISEGNAATSEANAATSEANSLQSATIANQHRISAENSSNLAAGHVAAAQTEAVNSAASAAASDQSATDSANSAVAAAASESNALASENAAAGHAAASSGSADQSATSATESSTSAGQSATSATQSANSATTATTQAGIATQAAVDSGTARDASQAARAGAETAESNAAGSATAAAGSASTAQAEANNAAAERLLASYYATYGEDLVIPGTTDNSAKHYAAKAASSAASASGQVVFLGSWDAAVNGTPPTPSNSARYIIISDGVVDGKNVYVNDFITYSVPDAAWYVTPGSGNVSSVNGYIGAVDLDYGDFAGAQNIVLGTAVEVQGKTTGGTPRNLINMNSGNVVVVGNTVHQTRIDSAITPFWSDGTTSRTLLHTGGGQTITGNLTANTGFWAPNNQGLVGYTSANVTSYNIARITGNNAVQLGNQNLPAAIHSSGVPQWWDGSTTNYLVHTAGGQTISGALTIQGSGTIAATTFDNGWLKIGNSTTGWAFDSNEIYAAGSATIGTLAGTLTLDGQDNLNVSSTMSVTGTISAKQINSTVYGNTHLGSGSGASTANYLTHGTSGAFYVRTYDGTSYSNALTVSGGGNTTVYGSLSLLDNKALIVGTGTDLTLQHNGTNSYIDNSTNSMYLRNLDTTGNIVLQAKGTDGTTYTVAQVQSNTANPYFRTFYAGAEKTRTVSDGLQIYGAAKADSIVIAGGGTFTAHLESTVQNEGIKFAYVANASTPAIDTTGSYISGGADYAGLSKRNNIDVATWYGFSVSPTYGSGTIPRGSPAFSVDARSGAAYIAGSLTLGGSSGVIVDNTSGNRVRVSNSSGYLIIGPNNTSACHFYTDRTQYYFDHKIQVDGTIQVYGSSTYLTATEGYVAGNKIAVLNGNAFTGLNAFYSETGTVTSFGGATTMLEVTANTGSSDAAMRFHVPGTYAAYLALSAAGEFVVGGYSMGGVSYRLWHYGNTAENVPRTAPELPGSVDLNNYTSPGFYYQSANADATSGSNYPVAQAGSLIVLPSAGKTQLYVTYNGGSAAANPRLFIRNDYQAATGWTEFLNTKSSDISIAGSLGIGVTPGNTFNNGKAIAVGDNDTGIRQNGDGVLELWANNQEIMQLSTGGIYSYKRHYFNAEFTVSSDRSLKTNLRRDINMPELREKLLQVNWLLYDRTDNDDKDEFGVIAQEIQKIFPEVVHRNPATGKLAVSYERLYRYWAAVNGWREHQFEALEARVANLEAA